MERKRHGGKRAGAGRKPLAAGRMTRISALVSEDDAALLREWGHGVLSGGLRWAIVWARAYRRQVDAPHQHH